MYVWVVLATFLAMIAAYFLPVREDMRDRVDIAVAQAKLVQFSVKQQAAQEYLIEAAWPYCKNANGTEVPGCNGTSMVVGYQTGVITDAVLSNYLPTGFVNDPDYVTAVYCMNKAQSSLRTGAGSCNYTPDTSRMLMTYGPIPSKWRQYDSHGQLLRPTMDFLRAMREFFGSEAMAGYTTMSGGSLGIANYQGTFFPIPSPMVSALSWSLKQCVTENGVCLAYMTLQ